MEKAKQNLCDYFEKYPQRLQTSVTKLNQCVEKYDKTKQAFNSTLTYLNLSETQQALVAGSTSCLNALNGLCDNLNNDLKNKGLQPQEAVNILTDFYNKVKN